MVDRFLVHVFMIASWVVLLSGAAVAGGGFVILGRLFGSDWFGWVVAGVWFAVTGGAAFLGWAGCVLAARLAERLTPPN